MAGSRRSGAGDLYRDPRYRAWKTAVFRRDGWRCQVCGRDVGGRKQGVAHHVKPVKAGGAAFDPANGITLCNRHHEQAHRERRHGGGGVNIARFFGCDARGVPHQAPGDADGWKGRRFG
ncbi:MAG: hypothetical protein GC191_08045 [Azospirillum sp.]|nr:hypothetical protein [Azospirillum sp.]